MKSLYKLIVLFSIYQTTVSIPEHEQQRDSYRQEFNKTLAEKRRLEDLKFQNNKEVLERLKQTRAQEDRHLEHQQAIEDYHTNKKPLNDVRRKEDMDLKAKRKQEDEGHFSFIKNLLWRDKERIKEDEDLQTKRKAEDQDLSSRKPSIKIDIPEKDLEQVHRTGQTLDHLLINQEFKKVISKVVDIENYQKIYHDLATGTIDIESVKRVQNSLKNDMKFSSEDLKIIQKHQKEIDEIISHINSLFDTKNEIYKTIENTLQAHRPPLTIKDVTPLLTQSINELKNINFDLLGNLNRNKAWYVFKETVIALVATPFVSAGAGMYAGKTVGLWAGAAAGGIAGISAAGILAIPGAAVGGVVGGGFGATLGALAGAYVGLHAAPIVAAARFVEALKNNYEYTIKRGSNKYEHTSGESQKAKLSPDAIWKKITPEDSWKHEKILFGGLVDALGKIQSY